MKTNRKPVRRTIEIGPAIKIEPDATYVIECDRVLSRDQFRSIEIALKEQAPAGCKFLILDAGMKIAREEKQIEQ